MNNDFADLHVHTIYSDGTLTPDGILLRAKESGLRAISLTDHDTAEFYQAESMSNLSANWDIELIPGVELSANYTKGNGTLCEVHVLGYFLDFNHEKMKKYFHEYREMRLFRARQILTKLNNMNVNIEMDDLNKEVKKNIYGRLHIAHVIIEKGYARTLREVFQNYIGNRSPAYVPKKQKTLSELTNLIKECSGIAVIAHPGLQGLENELEQLKRNGIDGAEVFHPDHSYSTTNKLIKQAENLNMLITGGSDYHGSAKEHIPLGSVKLPYKYVERLKKSRGIDAH